MMHIQRWLLGISLALILGLGLGGFVTYKLLKPAVVAPPVISVQTILQALKPQGFFITQSIITNQQVTIDKRTGNMFKDFFLGQTITARGTMEANLGVDLTGLAEKDIELTDTQITLRIPDVHLFNTRLIGDLEVENSQGIIKRLFQPDDGYNASLQALTSATEALASDTHIMDTARQRSQGELRRLVQLLAQDQREVVIEFQTAQ